MPTLDKWKNKGPFLTPFLREFYFIGFRNNPKDTVPELGLLTKLARSYLMNRAQLRATIGILACERYRLDHGSWPTSWEQLTPTYLKEILLDPFTGRAMLFKTLPDGLVIYSVGSDGKDDGGDVIRSDHSPKDTGYRLWNPDQRGINLDEKFNEEVKKMKQE